MNQPQPITPFEQFKRTYTPLYRVLLVLGLFSVLFSLASIPSVRTLIEYLSQDIYYALHGLISLLIVLPLMIASLILLWHKHPVGIRLRLAGYGVSIVASIVGLFTSQETIAALAATVQQANPQSTAGLSPEAAASITEASFYTTLYLSMFISLLFAHLWWKAWKKQLKKDKKLHEKSAA